MTRREEIQWEAGGIVNRMIDRGISQCYDTYYQAFQEGAKWADKTMLERILNYHKTVHPTFFEHFGDELIKAMEE